jgi:hypothetical protein
LKQIIGMMDERGIEEEGNDREREGWGREKKMLF